MSFCQRQFPDVPVIHDDVMATRKWALSCVLVPYLFVVLPIISSSQSACPQRCTCDTQRHQVNCQNAGLRHIPWDLPDPIGLTHLDLSGNEISELNAAILYNNLRFLDLRDNRITRIADGVLRDLPHLEELILKNNHLSEIGSDVFKDMQQLRQLDLSSNELTSLVTPIFTDLAQLEDLNLAGNRLNNFSATSFMGLESLHYLNLEDNRLSSLEEPGLFEEIRSLKVLSLGYNHLVALHADAFTELNMLRELNIEDNLISEIDIRAFSKIKPSPVPQMEKLNLCNNRLTEVPTATFTYLSNLESLDVSQNPIHTIEQGAFRGLENLRRLLIHTMPVLEMVQDYAFSELPHLHEVQMYSNHKLVVINEGAFLGSPEIRRVNLHANALRTLSVNLLDWANLEQLDLKYNRWHCDCHLAWLADVLLERLNNSIERTEMDDIQCFSPPSLARRLIIDLRDSNLQSGCSLDVSIVTPSDKPKQFQDNIMIAIMCTVGGILVVIIVVLMCKYGSSYRTAYAPAMDQYVYRNPNKGKNSDIENQSVPVFEGKQVRNLRSSLSSVTDVGKNRERTLYRVRFAEGQSHDPDEI